MVQTPNSYASQDLGSLRYKIRGSSRGPEPATAYFRDTEQNQGFPGDTPSAECGTSRVVPNINGGSRLETQAGNVGRLNGMDNVVAGLCRRSLMRNESLGGKKRLHSYRTPMDSIQGKR